MARENIPASVIARGKPNIFDVITILCVMALGVYVASVTRQILQPMNMPEAQAIHLSLSYLPEYSLRTMLRMFLALIASVIFTFVFATMAAKSKKAERIILPMLDILQSVPVLGFLTFTVTFFLALFPGRILGPELAAVFAIFTSQVWNMTFSMYQALKTLPSDLDEAAKCFGLTSWQRFWKVEVPVAMPGLIWNTMMSMSGGWFMIVYSETITIGDTNIVLPGIGSYVGAAIDHKDIYAIFYAVIAMFAVILAYDQFLFRPLVAWSEKFRFENVAAEKDTTPWLLRLMYNTSFIRWGTDKFADVCHQIAILPLGKKPSSESFFATTVSSKLKNILYALLFLAIGAGAAYYIYITIYEQLPLKEVFYAFKLGFITLLRVFLMVIIASLIWLPLGILLGLRPKYAKVTQIVAQFMAAFPANLLFPFVVMGIVHFHLSNDIWLTPLIILGTQWYILFNVVGGASTFPGDLREVAINFKVKGWLWWFKVMIPAVFPYYVTGALTAFGGAWNASIAAELVSWGSQTLEAHGLGAYIAQATNDGNSFKVGLGMVVMSTFVIFFNRVVWHPLYDYAQRRLSLS